MELMLIGRVSEMSVAVKLVESARTGAGGAVHFCGKSGIGKTTLLDAVAEQVADRVRVVRLTGIADEAEMPFAALQRLLTALSTGRDGLTAPMRFALDAAFGLIDESVNRFFVSLAALKMLSHEAQDTTLAVVIDEYHALDDETARVIGFIARRIDDRRICIVAAGQEDMGSFREIGDVVILGPLTEGESDDLLARMAPSSAPSIRARILAKVGGVPLQLRGVVGLLTDEQLAGRTDIPDQLPDMSILARIARQLPARDDSLPAMARGAAPGNIDQNKVHQELPVELDDADLLLHEVVAAFSRADFGHMGKLMDRLRDRSDDLLVLARTTRLQAVHILVTRSPLDAVEMLTASAALTQHLDPCLTAEMLRMAISAAWLAGHEDAAADARAMLVDLAVDRPEDATDRPGTEAVAMSVLMGPLPLPAPALPRKSAAGLDSAPTLPVPYVACRQLDHASASHSRLLAQALESGDSGSVPLAAYWSASRAAWEGKWDYAMRHAETGLTTAEQTGQTVLSCHLRALLAWLSAVWGDADSSASHTTACVRDAAAHQIQSASVLAGWAAGFAALGQGRLDQAAGQLGQSLRPGQATPAGREWLAWSDLVESHYRAFEPEQAEKAMREWEKLEAPGGAGAEALQLRCKALLEKNTETMVSRFYRALATQHPNDFERARTRLLFGERLRRARRLKRARKELQEALHVFRATGSVHWASRAQWELDACAVRTANAERSCSLTAQEIQVVRLAREGLTNHEIAQILFISPRTVGYHLYKAFPKLNIHSRREIVDIVLAGEQTVIDRTCTAG